MARVYWFRRDRRVSDNLALNEAIQAAKADGDAQIAATFMLDLDEFNRMSLLRKHSLNASLDALGAKLERKLTIRHQPAAVGLIEVARAAGAKFVHATRAFDTEGITEQNAAGLALRDAGIQLVLADSYYSVRPGSVLKGDGTPFRVYTPFYRAWEALVDANPVRLEPGAVWIEPIECHGRPELTTAAPFPIKAGEDYALETLTKFKARALADYAEDRNRADLSGTSHLSHALAHGEIHPRTILHGLPAGEGSAVFRKEIAWREFYADVLWNNQHTLTDYYEPKFAKMRYDSGPTAEARLEAWKFGKTGYPMVDAGMRQLLTTGWMHNRVRMIVASFLVKDLHLEWQQGAAWFEANLTDYDPASNAHGWQWTAGCGTDASPYFRVFNPIMQGYKFDPDGNYVRRYIPELRHVETSAVHEPWLLIDGLAHGYPAPIVDHAKEREESLTRLEELKLLGKSRPEPS